MIEFENTALVIVASMAGKGLPGQAVVDVHGRPLIAHAAERLEAARIGKILVAAQDHLLAERIAAFGLDVMVATPAAKGLSDKAAAILGNRDPQSRYQHILVMPAELAAIDTHDLRRCLSGLANVNVDWATLACQVPSAKAGQVAVVAPLEGEREIAYARDFTAAQAGAPARIHLPCYAWHRKALNQFAGFTSLAIEPARALGAGLRCAVVKVDSQPLSVDTPQDLEAFRRLAKG